jgi:hypothetical protein
MLKVSPNDWPGKRNRPSHSARTRCRFAREPVGDPLDDIRHGGVSSVKVGRAFEDVEID